MTKSTERMDPRLHRILTASLGTLTCLAVLLIASTSSAVCDFEAVDPCASPDPMKDCDQDGLNNLEECVGGVMPGGLPFPSCRVDDTVACVDPTKLDVFVVWEKDASSVYDALGMTTDEIFEPFTLPLESGGMDTNVHILPAGSPRFVTATQAAVVSTEDATDPGSCPVTEPLGITDFNSNPNLLANGVTVYSGRISRYVDCVYDSAGDTTTDRSQDKKNQLIRTNVHELAHHSKLANDSNKRFNGFHLRAGSGCTMDQTSVTSIKKGVVKITSPRTFCSPHQNAHQAGNNAQGATHCGVSGDTSAPFDGCLAAD